MFWYEDEVRALENKVKAGLPPSPRLVFYGSSSVRLWETLALDFPQSPVLNLGFGGSTLAAGAWFFERLVVPAQPDALVIYAGDNDLGDGRHPEEVYLFFCALVEKVRRHFPDIPLVFLSIKPSPTRWSIIDRIRFTNQIISQELRSLPDSYYVDVFSPMLDARGFPRRELFADDGLHLSHEGYRLWQQVLSQQAQVIFNDFLKTT
jgi:lysophospholipase L1-like esterase